jgi:hypothetical protein
MNEKKEKKSKYITEACGYEDGWRWQIGTRVDREGKILTTGHINTHEERGYYGTYKNKTYWYKEKLPKGFVRHHIFYDDEHPEWYIMYVTAAEHKQIHTNKLTESEIIRLEIEEEKAKNARD